MHRIIAKGAVMLLAGTILGIVLLWFVYLLPVTEESIYVKESINILEREGWYPAVPLMYQDTGVPSGINLGGILDNFTDSIMITTA